MVNVNSCRASHWPHLPVVSKSPLPPAGWALPVQWGKHEPLPQSPRPVLGQGRIPCLLQSTLTLTSGSTTCVTLGQSCDLGAVLRPYEPHVSLSVTWMGAASPFLRKAEVLPCDPCLNSALNPPMAPHCPPHKTKLSSRPCPPCTLIFPMLSFNHRSSHTRLPTSGPLHMLRSLFRAHFPLPSPFPSTPVPSSLVLCL